MSLSNDRRERSYLINSRLERNFSRIMKISFKDTMVEMFLDDLMMFSFLSANYLFL